MRLILLVMSETRPGDPRPYVYAALCLALAVLYFVLFRRLIPSVHGSTQAMAYGMMAVMVAMAVALVVRKPWAWWIAVAGSGYMLLMTLALFFLVIHSAAFLGGVYGAFGQGAASMAYLGAALIIQAVGLVPGLLMKFLMTRAGRRCFGLEPLWARRSAAAEPAGEA